MTNEELDHLARCEDAMKQARWAIALQLSRWRDGESVCAVGELQNAYDALADLVGDAKPNQRLNPPPIQTQDLASISSRLCLQLKRALRFMETEYVVAKREHAAHSAMMYLAQLNASKQAIADWEAAQIHACPHCKLTLKPSEIKDWVGCDICRNGADWLCS